MSLNERLSFEQMLAKWGHWCVLRRFERDISKSASYDAYFEESSRAAIQELTDGRPYSDHLLKMIKRVVVPGFEKRSKLGSVAVPGHFFYIQSKAKPTRQDWVLEIAQTEDTDLKQANPVVPYQIVRYYNLMDVDEMRMELGRIAYFRCRVEESQVGGHG